VDCNHCAQFHVILNQFCDFLSKQFTGCAQKRALAVKIKKLDHLVIAMPSSKRSVLASSYTIMHLTCNSIIELAYRDSAPNMEHMPCVTCA